MLAKHWQYTPILAETAVPGMIIAVLAAVVNNVDTSLTCGTTKLGDTMGVLVN